MRILAPESWLELVAEALAVGPCTSVAFGRSSLAADAAPPGFDYVRTFLPSTNDSPRVRAELEHALRSLAETTGAAELANLRIEFKELPPEDYATSWKKSWRPFRARKLCVLAPWTTSKPRAGDRILHLEPGGAFGTGRHPTTRTCLFVLQERIRGNERVLDAGSGSGILAVTAALLGARECIGFDIDPTAEPYANDLAARNELASHCRFLTGGFEQITGTFDVVLANIYADIIQSNVAQLRDALSPTGWYAFSGCAAHHADATRNALLAAGLTVDEERVRGRWHTFVGTRGA